MEIKKKVVIVEGDRNGRGLVVEGEINRREWDRMPDREYQVECGKRETGDEKMARIREKGRRIIEVGKEGRKEGNKSG